MRLLILTQYFPPETGAPQNRLFELALRLKEKGVDVEILTAMPNYPKMEITEGYKGLKYKEEELEGLKVYRSKIYVSKEKGIIKRLMVYFSFVWSSYKVGKKLGKYDYLMCESPPLFLGYSAMRLSKKLKAKLIFNVSDLWPESAEKMGIVTNKFFLKMAYNLEAKIYRKSFFISGQATGIVGSIKKRFPEKDVYWLSNGVDTKRIDPAKIEPYGLREKYNIPADHTVYFYGGILGHAQGLQIIINAAVSFKGEKATFVLMGSGPEKDDLLKLQKEVGADNVIFAEPVGRTEVANVLKEVDASIIPLRKLDVFEGVIPSKIFEVLAMQKPIILGVNGESKAFFIDEAKAGLHYEPENTEALVNAIRYSLDNPEEMIQFGKNGRSYVEEKFDRDLLVNNFYAYLKEKHEN